MPVVSTGPGVRENVCNTLKNVQAYSFSRHLVTQPLITQLPEVSTLLCRVTSLGHPLIYYYYCYYCTHCHKL